MKQTLDPLVPAYSSVPMGDMRPSINETMASKSSKICYIDCLSSSGDDRLLLK